MRLGQRQCIEKGWGTLKHVREARGMWMHTGRAGGACVTHQGMCAVHGTGLDALRGVREGCGAWSECRGSS